MKRSSSNKKTTKTQKPSLYRNMNKGLLATTIILLIFGLIMILSASSVAAVREYGREVHFFFTRQLIFAIAGLCLSMFVIKLSPNFVDKMSLPAVVVIVGVLIYTISYGKVTNGSTSWIYFGPIGLQPSEFAKTIMIVSLATLYGRLLKKFDGIPSTMFCFIPAIVIFILIALQPDLGTAMIIFIISILIYFFLPIEATKEFKIFKIVLAVSIITLILAMPKIVGSENFISKQLSLEQRERIAEFNDPCHKYEDSGYQVCHGFIAINSGGVTGSGLGESTQKFLYLPEAYTDFIFPIIVEELGVVTAGIILIMYLVLLMQILTIAVNAVNLRDSIIAFGTFCYILAHIVVNLGGILALMPLTGVPLPFLSYGGSFLINLLVLLGLTQRVHINTKLAKTKKKA